MWRVLPTSASHLCCAKMGALPLVVTRRQLVSICHAVRVTMEADPLLARSAASTRKVPQSAGPVGMVATSPASHCYNLSPHVILLLF